MSTSKNPKFTVANCVIMNWEKPIFGKMGMYRDESLYYYKQFVPYARKHNISLIRTDFRFYDYKEKVFNKCWIQDPLMGWVRAQDIPADLIHDLCKHRSYLTKHKQYFARKNMYGANPYKLDLLLSDKLRAYKKLKSYYPQTIAVNNTTDLLKAASKIDSEKIVLKPIQGSSAKGVHILERNELENFQVKENYLAQEFIIAKKPVQDFRVVFANGKVLHYYTRVAKRGSLFSNFSRGAKMYMLKKSEVPAAVIKKWQEISDFLQQFPYSMLTADFMLDVSGKAWLIEMNTKPGKVLYRPNNALPAFKQIMKATVENYQLMYQHKYG